MFVGVEQSGCNIRSPNRRFLFRTGVKKKRKNFIPFCDESQQVGQRTVFTVPSIPLCASAGGKATLCWGFRHLVWGCSLKRNVSLYHQGLWLVPVKLLHHVLRLLGGIQLNSHPHGAPSDSDKKLTGWGTTMHADANVRSWKPLHSATVWSLSLFCSFQPQQVCLEGRESRTSLPPPPNPAGQLFHRLWNRFNTELSEAPFASLSLKQLLQRQRLS